jgi:hypothetical protein
MFKEPSQLAAARAELEKADGNLRDPASLGHLRNAIKALVQLMSGVSPRIEKDIAKKLVLTYRNKVLSEAKVILADLDSYEPGDLGHWNKVMEVFVDASVSNDPEFEACKYKLITKRANQPINTPNAANDSIVKTNNLQVADRQNELYLKMINEARAMLFARSLRAIGQSLERLRLRTFQLEKTGDFFIVRSKSLTATHQWILKNNLAEIKLDLPGLDQKDTQLAVGDECLCYGPLDIARLNAWELKKRDFNQSHKAERLAQLLAILGEQLDSKKATAFKISWVPDLVSVDYQMQNGVREHKYFTVEKLQKLALYSRLQNARRSGV